jgi:hypothetical protein
MGHFFALASQLCLCLFALRNIDGGTDVAKKNTVRLKAWNPVVENPAILTVISAQAVFHRELFSRVK